jgi:hypothetical protein
MVRKRDRSHPAAVLLKPLPYSDPGRLVWMYGAFRGSDSAAVSPFATWGSSHQPVF